jgi:hypothetical protein
MNKMGSSLFGVGAEGASPRGFTALLLPRRRIHTTFTLGRVTGLTNVATGEAGPHTAQRRGIV